MNLNLNVKFMIRLTLFWIFVILKVEGSLVVLRNVGYPNLCLHVVGSNDNNNQAIDTATCDGNDHGQLLRLDESSSNSPLPVYFVNGLCLGVSGGVAFAAQQNAPLAQVVCGQQTYQKWKLYQLNGKGPGTFEIQTAVNGRCITAQPAKNGNLVNLWDCWQQPHQFWKAEQVRFALENIGNPGNCLTKGGSKGLTLTACDASKPEQQFTEPTDGAAPGSEFWSLGDGTECLTGGETSAKNGDPVSMGPCTRSQNQMWKDIQFARNPGTIFKVQNQVANLCLTLKREVAIWICILAVTHPAATIKNGDFASTPNDPNCSGGCCNPSKCSLDYGTECCAGSYCKEVSVSERLGMCVIQCGDANKPCVNGACCGNGKCVNGVCKVPDSDNACRTDGQQCGVSPFAQGKCCAGSSCKAQDSKGLAICAKGDCLYLGQECTPGGVPCCTRGSCENYKGVNVCRPAVKPNCGRRNGQIDGCRVGDGGFGYRCCGGYCQQDGTNTYEGVHTYKNYKCPCSSINHICYDDSDCCNSQCGFDYICET